MRKLLSISSMAAAALLLSGQLNAAESVSILPPQSADFQITNLTTFGKTDWLKWTDTNAFTHKASGGGDIGTYIRVDSNGYPNDFDPFPSDNGHSGFTWTDGDSSMPSTPSAQYGSVIFDPAPSGSTFGTKFQFTVFPGAGSGSLRFWGMSASADALLQVSLKNASNQTLASDFNSDFTNPAGDFGPNYLADYYDIPFSGLQNGDKLVLQYSVESDNGNDIDGHGYVGLMAAALNVTTPTPEPGTLAMLGIAGAGLLLRRRRKSITAEG